MDRFGDQWIVMFGDAEIANYVHIWIAGHVRYFLRQFGNVYRMAQHGFEGKMTNVRTYRKRRTNQGSVMSLTEAMKKYILRSIAWTIEALAGGEGCGYIEKLMEEGRKIMLSKRAEDYRLKKEAARLNAANDVQDGADELQRGVRNGVDFEAEDEDLAALQEDVEHHIFAADDYLYNGGLMEGPSPE
jgi:hypothetical protein